MILFAFFLGTLIGSFYTATASRILYFFYGEGRKTPDRWKQIFFRPSFCFHCKEKIPPLDLIPLMGYLRNRGRCRHCHYPIGIVTLLGELWPGFLLAYLIYFNYSVAQAFFLVLLSGHLLIAFATDWKHYSLDHENTIFVGLFALAAGLEKSALSFSAFWPLLATSAGVGVILWVLNLFFPDGFGFGDVLLGSSLALYAGLPWTIVIFEVAAAGSIIHIYWILKDRKAPAPFGSYLVLGFFVALLAEAIY
ncbi:MAG: prepilin peptidase [Spirochaetales bacterium]|nr:prepilin peptidase [Spirochaetales bacterium]